jgi:hypothetical protein
MATNIKDYSTTQASNTSLNSIFVGEGMLPSNLNNAIRALMKNTRDWFNDAEWIEYGDGSGAYTSAYVSGTSFTIAGADVTSVYHAGRRIKVIAPSPGTIYGTISSSSFSTDTTVNVTWDSGSLSNEAITNIFIGILSKTNNSIPTELITDAQVATGANINAAKLGTGVVDNTEFNYLNGVTSNIQTQLDAKQATITGGASTITSSNLTASRALESNGSGKVAASSVTSTELGYLSGVTSAIQTQFSNKQPLDAQLTDIAGLTPTDSNFIVGNGTNFVAESGATVRTSLGLGSIATQDSNNVTITGGSITGMSTPSLGSDVTTKTYVDDLVAGLKTRIITRLATTANLDLATDLENGDTLDGVSLVTGNKILVKDQTNQTQNGIYIVPASGAASRDPDFDTVAELAGQLVIVQEGSTNADKIYLCTTDNSGSIGSVNITFSQVQPSFTGTVTSVAVADAGSSEFTVSGSPITSSGTITLAVNSIDASKIGNGDVSNTELSYVNGVTSAIQTQINGKLANVVEDTTPQLGGNLDVNTNSIVSTSNGDITLAPDGTGVVNISGNATQAGNLRIFEDTDDGTNYIGLKAGTLASSFTLTLPIADGTADQVLKTDGSGNLSFADASGGGIQWQSSIVTGSTLTAVAGNGYWIDTTSNTCTITLPASASAGDQIIFTDYARKWGTNKIIIDSNGLNYQGDPDTSTVEYNTNGQTVNIVYSGATKGWIPVSDDDVTDAPLVPPYSAEYLIVAGGGSGGKNNAGGGGAGGYLTNYSVSTITLTGGEVYTVTVGAGGASQTTSSTNGNAGSNSVLSGTGIATITAIGGGAGGTGTSQGGSGGSGGGNGYFVTSSGGSGTVGQGNDGGSGGANPPEYGAGGGGGAGAVGGNGTSSTGGNGGVGLSNSITGSATFYAGGGGGSANSTPASAGAGGNGGGGAGAAQSNNATSGTANTGGGGGGAESATSGAGGSGVVILRVPTANYSTTTTGSPTVTTDGTDTVIKFTGSGSYTA